MDRCVPCGVANDAADVDDTPELTDGEGESDPDLEEPENKKVKLNYDAKTTSALRVQQYPFGTFKVRDDCMWCCACQKPICHKRSYFMEILRAGSIQCDTNMKDLQHHLLWTKSSGIAPCLHCSWSYIYLHLLAFFASHFLQSQLALTPPPPHRVHTCHRPTPPIWYGRQCGIVVTIVNCRRIDRRFEPGL